jgi:hypothetical protein
MAQKIYDDLILPKTSGKGIKIDTDAPTFGWRDLEYMEFPDPAGTDAPQITTFLGGVRSHFYQTIGSNDKMDLRGHIPHDYVPGTDMYVHIHWSHDGTAISGGLTLTHECTLVKGHNQAAFPTTKTQTITYSTVNIATTPRWYHMITEVALTSDGGSATLFDRALIEVDGLIIATLTLTGLPTITGGTTVGGGTGIWVHRSDLHYQSNNMPTKQKAPNFYV